MIRWRHYERTKVGYANMFYQELKKNSYYIFSDEIELMFAAINILDGEKGHNLSEKTYGRSKLNVLKNKYAFLMEVFGATGCPYGIMEPLADYPVGKFNLDAYCDYLLRMDTASFLSVYFTIYKEELVREAMEDEEAFEKLYREYSKFLGSYLGCKTFFRESKKVILDFFSFIKELDTKDFHKKNESVIEALEKEANQAKEELERLEPLEYSQKIMGKIFHNRGPYQEFYFSPSLFATHTKMRIFGKNQILFYSLRELEVNQERILKQLKAVGDDTRFKIIALLNEKEPLRGLDIAKELSMAPSTISHHMEQLKSCGLLNEEQDKSSKYYSISRNNAKELLEAMKKLLEGKAGSSKS